MSDPRKVQSDKEWLEKFKQQTDAQKEVERLEEVERCWELVVVENVHGTISSKTIWLGQGPCPKKICALNSRAPVQESSQAVSILRSGQGRRRGARRSPGTARASGARLGRCGCCYRSRSVLVGLASPDGSRSSRSSPRRACEAWYGRDQTAAELRASVEFTNGDVVVLDGPGSLLALPPGETTIPLVEGFVVPDCPEIPNGLYHFTVVPLDPETGLSVADHAQFRLFRSGS